MKKDRGVEEERFVLFGLLYDYFVRLSGDFVFFIIPPRGAGPYHFALQNDNEMEVPRLATALEVFSRRDIEPARLSSPFPPRINKRRFEALFGPRSK
uniref:Uncharacterized protein n=1 Tax=Candidatus Kentrum eta TaxID=2126337 RepID=A0A450U6U2_9GAMM|nr:MAG: hypothetical protein BECKH772A_GA0070896_100033 [Candidatus Kentron sp. H]VFJ88946.1 MAG: hypothetical protein BECKH772B_GA0070898_100033 [Candidatus Kentron sp. H]VFJ95684.1 MAG: hypothetical protein BECKH772C_GA0070978_100033 [Candidatus Kentron sp. H]